MLKYLILAVLAVVESAPAPSGYVLITPHAHPLQLQPTIKLQNSILQPVSAFARYMLWLILVILSYTFYTSLQITRKGTNIYLPTKFTISWWPIRYSKARRRWDKLDYSRWTELLSINLRWWYANRRNQTHWRSTSLRRSTY